MLEITKSKEFESKLSEIGLDQKSREILISFFIMYENLKDNSLIKELIFNYLFS